MSRASFACDPARSLGRVQPEPDNSLRTPFQRDRDRILHSLAFRRLQYKTQVFVNFEGDHFRTRLTHSLEVAQIARTLARILALDEDLAEAVALAHDLGHSPFGHAGERALADALQAFGGFDHNLQTFRVVTRLEQRHPDFDGLNLTFETLDGLLKHNGPLAPPIPAPITDHPVLGHVRPDQETSLEAQVAALADDIAYVAHDVEDGLRAGFFSVAELAELPLADGIARAVRQRWPELEAMRQGYEIHRRLLDGMVQDVVHETRARLASERPNTVEEIRRAGRPMAAFSPDLAAALAELRRFLGVRMYRHYKVSRMSLKAGRLIRDLASALLAAPDCLPGRWAGLADVAGSPRTASTVRDYIAGMTDRFAVDEHDRLFKLSRDRA